MSQAQDGSRITSTSCQYCAGRELIGFLPIDEDVYQVWWGNTWLGDFDAWAMKCNPRKTIY
jgi:hypothetical protein